MQNWRSYIYRKNFSLTEFHQFLSTKWSIFDYLFIYIKKIIREDETFELKV